MTRRGFSLVELLIVLAIILIAMSMVVAVGRRDRRGIQVRAAAEELAGVLRQTRANAMERKSIYGVVFNLANARGSSGRILNNREGGHWYRVLGPQRANEWTHGYSVPPRFNRDWAPGGSVDPNAGRDFPVASALSSIQDSWAGERRTLPRGEVRFLALADQDNGASSAPGMFFGPTYPRPWCGWWDAGSGRLYGWGGYDPEIKAFAQNQEWWRWNWVPRTNAAGQPLSFTGFFYEGNEGTITGCTNAVDRLVVADSDGDGFATPADTRSFPLLKQGEARPLVNGDWMDAVIWFLPDGSARYEDWFPMRHQYSRWWGWNDAQWRRTNGRNNLHELAMGDMTNDINDWSAGHVPPNCRGEVAHYVDRTGSWFLTLAPDVSPEHDDATFPTAQAAVASMMPMYRVGVSRLGAVRVVEVRRRAPAGTIFDSVARDGWWENRSCGLQGYWNNLLNAPDGTPRRPVEDFVTADMLAHRQWWME